MAKKNTPKNTEETSQKTNSMAENTEETSQKTNSMAENTEETSQKTNLMDEDTLRAIFQYIDEKQDSRTDYISNQLSWSNLWLFIIALYFIFKFAIAIGILLFQKEVLSELLKIATQYLST